MKTLRMTLGGFMVAFGVILFILPGSILALIGGLLLLSYDWLPARKWLKVCQNSMSKSARFLDSFLYKRKYYR